MAAGRFRTDLYYRLNVFPVEIPSLRQRLEDIPLLGRFFLHKYAKKLGKRFTDIDSAGLEHLRHYHWPGNVRELQNVIERAVILSPGPLLEIPLLSSTTNLPGQPPAELQTLETMEREHIQRTLSQTAGVISGPKGAAAILGMNANTLRSRMLKLGIGKL
jgi:DNA-binding NtrC family response regulator